MGVSVVSRLAAIVMGLVALILFAFAIWNFAFQATFFAPETFKNGLADQQIYNDVVPVALPALLSLSDVNSEIVSLQDISEALGPEDWQTITRHIIPPQWLQAQVERSIDLFFDWINGNPTATSVIAVDFQTLHDRLNDEVGAQVVQRIISGAPRCTEADLVQLQELQNNRPVSLPICQPPEEYIALTRSVLSDAFSQLASGIPTSGLSLADIADTEDRASFTALSLTVQIYRSLVSLLYLCPAALVALIVTLVVRSLKSFGRWTGSILVTGGILALVPLPLISLRIIGGLTNFLTTSGQSPELRLFEARLLTGLIRSAFSQFSQPVVIQSAVMIITGVVLLVIAYFAAAPGVPRSDNNDQRSPSSVDRNKTITISTEPENNS